MKKVVLKSLVVIAAAIIFGAATSSCGKNGNDDNVVKEFTVTFNSNQGTPVEPIKVKEGELAPKPDNPARTNHTFIGWYKELGGINEWNFETDRVNSDIILYAKWEEDEIPLTGIQIINMSTGEPVDLTEPLTVWYNNSVTLQAQPLPANQNEIVPFAVGWTSDDDDVATVVNGAVTGDDVGDAVITVTVTGKTSITVDIEISVVENPITEIQVPATLSMIAGGTQTLNPVFLPANYSVKAASAALQWSTSNANIVDVTQDGELEAVGNGEATITVSLISNPAVKADITVTVTGAAELGEIKFADFEPYVGHHPYQGLYQPTHNLQYAKLNLQAGREYLITGFTGASYDLERAYNRDFMDWDEVKGTVTFTGQTGEWDVYYSETINYFWVQKDDAVYPETMWMRGRDFTHAAFWHSSNSSWSVGIGIGFDPRIIHQGYMKPLGNDVFQAHVYMAGALANFFLLDNVNAWTGETSDYDLIAPPQFEKNNAATRINVTHGGGNEDYNSWVYVRVTYDRSVTPRTKTIEALRYDRRD